MAEIGQDSIHTPAQVVLDIPHERVQLLINMIAEHVHPELLPLIEDVLGFVPHDLLLDILKLTPESNVRIIDCINEVGEDIIRVRYGSWMKHELVPDCVKGVDWKKLMEALPLRDQKDHNVCWAIVVSELIWALRQIQGRENGMYSVQELIDFVDREQRGVWKDAKHLCYTSNLTNGFEYAMKRALQRDEQRPFTGCPEEIPDYIPSCKLGYIEDYKRINTIQEAFLQLIEQPIGFAVALFSPEYNEIGDKIYRGPTTQNSRFRGMHAVSLMSVHEENGESYVLARASHGDTYGDGGYLKISLDVVLVYIPIPGERVHLGAKKYFSKPRSLIGRFSYPRLLTEAEEEIREKKMQEKIDQDKMERD